MQVHTLLRPSAAMQFSIHPAVIALLVALTGLSLYELYVLFFWKKKWDPKGKVRVVRRVFGGGFADHIISALLRLRRNCRSWACLGSQVG